MTGQILEYFQKHRLLVEENLSLCGDPRDVEAIHNFRLSVKRIRVVGKLADLLGDDPFDHKNRLKAVNALFKRAGRLRDVQVTLQLMKDLDNSALDPVIEKFAMREGKLRSKFEKALQEYDNACLDDFGTALENSLEAVREDHVFGAGLRMLSGLEHEVHEIYYGSTSEKRLHSIRTRLKNINYLNNAFGESLPVEDHLNIKVERLRELGEIAGSWHDALNLESKFGKFIRKHPEAVDATSLQDIILELRKKKQALYQEYTCILLNEMKV
jgi:CHAD domain-containing protein